ARAPTAPHPGRRADRQPRLGDRRRRDGRALGASPRRGCRAADGDARSRAGHARGSRRHAARREARVGMLRALRLLNLRRLRRQPLRVLIALISVAAGVALVAALPVVSASTKKSLDAFGRSLAGPAPLRVIGPIARGGLDESVVDKVAATPGVAA